jgi:cysteine dioxygenase
MPGITKEQDNFHSLVQALSDKLGPCSGIDSDDVDERELQQLMQDYTSDESEWSKYFFPSPHMAYTRNLVDKGNGKSNLVQYLLETCRGRELT